MSKNRKANKHIASMFAIKKARNETIKKQESKQANNNKGSKQIAIKQARKKVKMQATKWQEDLLFEKATKQGIKMQEGWE